MLFCLCVSFLLSLWACAPHKESYLSFLDANAEYEASLIINGEVSATFILTKEGKDEDGSEVLHLRFTSPEVLSRAEISYIGGECTLTYNGIVLDGYDLPRVWNEIFELFSPDGEVSEVQVKDGKSFISVLEENRKATVYVLENDGTLFRIESDITVEIKSIRDHKEGSAE